MKFKATLTAIVLLAFASPAWAQSTQQPGIDLPQALLNGFARFIAVVPWWIWVLLIIALPVGLWLQREDEVRKRMREQELDEEARRRRAKRGW